MRGAFSAVELVVATVILAAAAVPLFSAFSHGRGVATQSRLAYLAIQVAREELEELRQLPLTDALKHGWEPVKGNLFRWSVGRGGSAVTAASLSYPPEYRRLRTRLTLAPTDPPDPRYRKAVLEVRWEESGAGTDHARDGIGRFETLLANHHVEGR